MKNICQSCAIPFSKDPKNGGTNSDGSKSEMYCSYCFVNGKFTSDITDVEEYQKFVIQKMKDSGMNGILAWLFTRGIPKLKRWNK